MSLHVLLLGLTIGFVAVLPPGPVALSLIEVGIHHGRTGGARGGLGVAGGDTLVASVAAGVVLLGGALPATFFAGLQLLSGGVLLGLGLLLFVQPGITSGIAQSVVHPGRTFFVLTAVTPTVFGAWLAMITAMPFAQDPLPVVVFVAGGMVASLGYHLVLGALAGDVGARLRPSVLRGANRLGGLAMVGFAIWTLA